MASSRSNLLATSSNAAYRDRSAQSITDHSPLNSAKSRARDGAVGGDEDATRDVELDGHEGEGQGDSEGGMGGAVDAFDDDRLSELEREVLREWRRLNGNLVELSTSLASLAATPSSQIADSLRLLERKTALVDTALKSSVYSIVLQQQISEGADGEEGG